MANKLSDLMKRSDKGAQLSRNVLTRAFRDFLTQLKMEEKTITALMEIYLRTPERQLSCGDDPTAVSYTHLTLPTSELV